MSQSKIFVGDLSPLGPDQRYRIIRIEIIGDYLILTVKGNQPQEEFKEVYKR